MTQIAINKQIQAIREVTQKALQTKETALQILVDAGIINGSEHQNDKKVAVKAKDKK